MRLSNPTHIRLSPELEQRLDSWRGDRMNRATAIRLLLEQALDLHRDGILPSTGSLVGK
jgi:predicted DNA-binding protein